MNANTPQAGLAEFLRKMATKGYVAFRLFVKEGESENLLDEWRLEGAPEENAATCFEVAQTNAQGFRDAVSAFVCRVFSETDFAGPGFNFSVRNEGGDVHDRFEPTANASSRLFLEQIDKDNKSFREIALKAIDAQQKQMEPLTQVVNGLLAPVTQMCASFGDAIAALRESRSLEREAELAALQLQSKQETKSALFAIMAPALQKFMDDGGGEAPQQKAKGQDTEILRQLVQVVSRLDERLNQIEATKELPAKAEG